MRVLGLDIGDIKIGAAVSDNEEKIALPLVVLKKNEKIAEEIDKLIMKYKVGILVVGIPYTLKGEIGNQAEKVMGFVKNCLDLKGLKIEYIDERYTSKIPKNTGLKKKKSGVFDDLSACLILQSYLDRGKKIENNNASNK